MKWDREEVGVCSESCLDGLVQFSFVGEGEVLSEGAFAGIGRVKSVDDAETALADVTELSLFIFESCGLREGSGW